MKRGAYSKVGHTWLWYAYLHLDFYKCEQSLFSTEPQVMKLKLDAQIKL